MGCLPAHVKLGSVFYVGDPDNDYGNPNGYPCIWKLDKYLHAHIRLGEGPHAPHVDPVDPRTPMHDT